MVKNNFDLNDETPREIDLSKPPVVRYTHQEYPKMLHGPNKTWTKVNNKQEEMKALKNGWSLKPEVEIAPPKEKVTATGFVENPEDLAEIKESMEAEQKQNEAV